MNKKPDHKASASAKKPRSRTAQGAEPRKERRGKKAPPISIWELEQQSVAGREVARAVGSFRHTPPDFWVHRTVLLIAVKITEHLLTVRRIVPRQMSDLLKSLTSTLLADVNRHRIQQAKGKASPALATEQEVQQFTDNLDSAVRRIYGLKLNMNSGKSRLLEAAPEARPDPGPKMPGGTDAG